MWVGATVPIGAPIGAGISIGATPGILTPTGVIPITTPIGAGILTGHTDGDITTTIGVTRITTGMDITMGITLADMAAA